MKNIILTLSVFSYFIFSSFTSFAANNFLVDVTEYIPEDVMEEAVNNRVPIIIIASLSVLLILFILLWLNARERASKRKTEAAQATQKLTEQTKKYETLKEEVLRLRTENSDLNVLLEKEKTKTENLNDQIQKFETTTTQLNAKVEELQKTIKPALSDAARQEIDNLEIKAAKLQNIAKLKEQNAITEAEAKEMKDKLLKEIV